ncbi:putative phage tail sheath protein [Azorhizobium caulinodans ORS 571]|uniref:Putative phage tail sheath protein n=1 Tax=Azorhizobium caulinodans (strain ATCC 43989 / DSM 5975 / JCM 20966 / LMG 6465 / NBRC 14845 / NCIMB 13405 / ORS 571) TaxID=438753 RepID=A8I7U2_AZOC5|nr:tail sheath protein [Azorhizobium caulinodans]BAF88160.1 putative phage tail sheath protein [Azorhizobium caulinodans ORS 571]
MSATTPFVGVRVFSDLSDTIASVDTRDSTVIGLTLPAPEADNARFPLDEPVALSIDDVEQVAALGPGLARDTVDQILSEGIVTDISFVRVAEGADAEATMGHIVGSAGAKTGVWAQLEAKDHIGIEPGLLIAPGYTGTRPGNAANPITTAMDAVCARIIDCMAVVDTPATSREAAALYAEDFKTSLNIIAMYPGAKVYLSGAQVVRPLSPHVAAAIVRRDKQVGHPFKAAWNRPLIGILGASQRVTYRDGDTSSDANYLVQAGVGTVIENKTLWAPFSTATDPTIRAYRSIKRIRTRRSIEKAFSTTLRGYLSEDLGGHLVTLLVKTLEEACEERKSLGALIDYQIVWDRKLNPNTFLRDGGIRLKLRFEETPDLTDLQIYSQPQPEAFDVLASSIADALSALGSSNVYVAS